MLFVALCARGCASLLVIVPWLGSRGCCFGLLYVPVVVLVLRFSLSRLSGVGRARRILRRGCRAAAAVGFRVGLRHRGQGQGEHDERPHNGGK